MRSVFLFLFFCKVITFSGAHQSENLVPIKKNDTLVLRMDSSWLQARTFEAHTLSKYKRDSTFDYKEDIAPANWWQQFKQWFYQWLTKLFANKGSALALKWLLILIGVAALLFVIYKLSGMSLMGIFGKKTNPIGASSLEEAENIHVIDFEEEINKAIKLGHFRVAVRLLYLQSLKDLSDKQLIDWQPGKTNRIYLQELHEKSFKQEFARLTGQFEYIWYGGFPIQEVDFEPLRHQFISFKQSIR